MSSTIIRVGGAAPDFRAFANFLDGETAAVQRAEISIREEGGGVLVIQPPERDPVTWPLDEIRQRPDQAAADVMLLGRAGGDPARLLVDDPDAVAILRARCTGLNRREPTPLRGRLLGWAAGAVASVGLIIFVLVPAIADRLAVLLPPEGEVALGDATFEQIRNAISDRPARPLAICDSPGGAAALAALQARLTDGLDLPYPVQAAVLDHQMVNAFALPGGRVVIFRGLLDTAGGPDEVAAVFAHEIGHVVNRDPAREALRSAGSIGVLGLIFGDFAGGTVALFLLNRLIDANYSQGAEAKADRFAHDILAGAGVPPSALAAMFERLLARGGDAKGIVAHFRSHPKLGDRIAAARAADALMTGPAVPSLDAGQWQALKRICR